MEMENMYILGDVFLKNYYQVYNLEEYTVSLGVNYNSTLYLVKEIPSGVTGMSASAKFFIVLLVFALCGCLVFAGWYFYKKK